MIPDHSRGCGGQAGERVWGRTLRLAALLLAAGLAGLSAVGGPALAQSCSALRAELARLQGGASAAGAQQAARYDRAWREQAAVFARTRDEARRAACFGGGFLFFRARPEPICRTLVPKLQKMEANLLKLERLRDRYARAAGDVRRMEQIRYTLERGACSDGGGFFARFFRPGEGYEEEVHRLPGYGGYGRDDGYSPYGGALYRTLCVRSCDGYYFPISFSTTSQRFVADRQMCEQMCPNAEVELYYHPDPGSDPESMMSVAGRPYTELPNAFRYRKELDPSCSCGKPAGQRVALFSTGGLGAAEDALGRRAGNEDQPQELAPRPRPRAAPAADPETLANRAGGFVPRSTAAPVVASESGATGRPVRVVGPAYWGARPEHDVLIAPLPN
jgi:hypothetical protein